MARRIRSPTTPPRPDGRPIVASQSAWPRNSPERVGVEIEIVSALRVARARERASDILVGCDRMDKLFVPAESLLRDSIQLAQQIITSCYRPTFLVAMWRGGAPIGIAVQEVLEYHAIPTDHIAIRTSSYFGIDNQNKTVRVHAVDYLVSRLSAEDQLLLIDDVFDSGRSLEAVIAELKRRCRRNLPDVIRIATVYYKPSRNRS